jgi:hypothetical protein
MALRSILCVTSVTIHYRALKLCYIYQHVQALLKAMRPRQWTKNVVLLAAVIFDRQLSISNPRPAPLDVGLLLFCLSPARLYH